MLILTNDDGIEAPGLRALLRATQILGQPAMIVAPRNPLSGCGHQVTTRLPIQIQQWADREYAIAGTPADCVRVALSHLCPNVQCVLSGINRGGNLGADVYISGTVAAVREAAFHRLPGLAISHYCQGGREIDWERATHLTVLVLARFLKTATTVGTFWNVNLPHLPPDAPDPEIVVCAPCTQPLPNIYRIEENLLYYAGEYSQRLRDPGGDVDVCFSGRIAVTQLSI